MVPEISCGLSCGSWSNRRVLPTAYLCCFSQFVFKVVFSCVVVRVLSYCHTVPSHMATEGLHATYFSGLQTFSQVKVPRNTKNYFKGSFTAEWGGGGSLANTALCIATAVERHLSWGIATHFHNAQIVYQIREEEEEEEEEETSLRYLYHWIRTPVAL